MINSASHAFCNQPSNGGPIYWIGNIAYHLPGGSTRLTNGSAGVLFYNNTILSETTAQAASNVHWRNNLFLGENSTPAIFTINTFTNYTSSDYNGFRLNPGAEFSFQWNSPPAAACRRITPAPDIKRRTPDSTLRDACRLQPGDASGSTQHRSWTVTVPEIPFDSDHELPQVLPDMNLGEVLGVAVNSKGRIVVLNHPGSATSGPLYGNASTQLLEFDQTGKFVREIGKGVYGLGYAHGVRFDKYDNLWVVDKGTQCGRRSSIRPGT